MEQQRWLSLTEAASLLKVGVPTVQSLINRGLLAGQQREGQVLVSYDAILAFLRQDQRALLEGSGQAPDLGLLSGTGEAS